MFPYRTIGNSSCVSPPGQRGHDGTHAARDRQQGDLEGEAEGHGAAALPAASRVRRAAAGDGRHLRLAAEQREAGGLPEGGGARHPLLDGRRGARTAVRQGPDALPQGQWAPGRREDGRRAGLFQWSFSQPIQQAIKMTSFMYCPTFVGTS